MCGIVGILTPPGRFPPEKMRSILEAMGASLAHRGPDGQGVWQGDGIGLAHARLGILDRRDAAAQPMISPDGRFAITYNGEIYNFAELRRNLEGQGHIFRTRGDCEVLLHGYRQWGADLPRRLRGMFAFAIWDAQERRLFLARDRFGKKPMVHARVDGAFVFASEAKALCAFPGFTRRVNPEAIRHYLSFGHTAAATSAFDGVARFPPAHAAHVEQAACEISPPARYWSLAPVDPTKAGLSRDDAAGELLERLDEAIAIRQRAELPIGAMLSGGIDSSAIVARLAPRMTQPLQTFCAGFDRRDYDETPHALAVSRLYGTRHRTFTMDDSLARLLPDVAWHYDEPFSDSSALVTMAMARHMGAHLGVAMTGDGGDELFLGYSRYLRFGADLAQADRSPGLLRDLYADRLAVFRHRHLEWGLGPALADGLLTPAGDALPALLETAMPDTAAEIAARVETGTALPDDLLVKADIAQMSAGLEGRSPFLDHEFADWAASLPVALRLSDGAGGMQPKALVKHALRRVLPAEILQREKQGFSVPVKHWLCGSLRDFTGDLLTSGRFRNRGYMRPGFVDLMLDRHLSGREDHGTRLWNLLMLELWHRTHMDPGVPAPLTGLDPLAGRAVPLQAAG